MKFRCPNRKCPGLCGPFDRACPVCGFVLNVGSVLRLYLTQARQATAVECVRCGKGVLPIGTKVCPVCGQVPTFQDAMHATVDPPRRRMNHYFRTVSPRTKRFAQWMYLLASSALLWWLLDLVHVLTGARWFAAAALSVLYLSAFGLFAAWWMPRRVLYAISRGASGMVKFSLALNFFSAMLVLQILISAWWARAGTLATLFVVLWAAARLLNHRVLPEAEAVRRVFFGAEEDVGASSPQGRSVRME